MLMKLFTINY